MKERDIQKGLYKMFNTHPYMFINLYFFRNESDWLSFLPSGYCYDVECKVTRSDFLADFKKPRHLLMQAAFEKKKLVTVPGKTTNGFSRVDWVGGRSFRNGYTEKPGRMIKGREVTGKSQIEIRNTNETANRFFFAVPKGLIGLEEVPEYAGLIEVDEFWNAKKVKDAPLLHKKKHDVTKKFNMIYRLYLSQLYSILSK